MNYDDLPKPLREVTAKWTGHYYPVNSPISFSEEINEIGPIESRAAKEYRIELTVGFLHQVHPDVPMDRVKKMALRAIAKELYSDIYNDLIDMMPEMNEVSAQLAPNEHGLSLREKYESLLNRIMP